PGAGDADTGAFGGFGAAGAQLPGRQAPPPARAPAPAAQTGPRAGFALPARPFVRAERTDEPPSIDGRLDDAVWRSATLVTAFTQTNPIEGAPPTERTEVRIAYDSDHLYFAFYAHYGDPTQMRANRVDRDQAWRDDWIAVMFDTFLDQQRAYRFSVKSRATPYCGAAGAASAPWAGAATGPGTRCSNRAGESSTTAGRRRWPSRSRACATRRAARANTAGGSRSAGPCRRRTRRWSGPR
ncbi:MAG: hypothetical protein J4F37_00730, partial [Acidobacteria bacterium]|nr:hypothetical protein [Acidobacteriota bacterium]